MLVYRYRSSGLLSQKGLLYDEWYFASREELNDPIEMQSKFEFPGRSFETWNLISTKFWGNSNEAQIIATYFANLSPISYEQLIKDFEKHKQIILNKTFKHRTTTLKELLEFRKKLDTLESTLSLYSPGSGYSVSLSKNPSDMLMWSHYASSHQGYCIIYRPIDGYLHQCPKRTKASIKISGAHSAHIGHRFKINEVHYRNQLDAIDGFNLLPCHLTSYPHLPEPDRLQHHSNIQNQLLTKNKCWEYEKECRLLLPQPSKYISGESTYSGLQRLFHYDFNQVVGIIFGARMPEHEKTAIREIVNLKLTNRFVNLGADDKKIHVFDFLFQEVSICASSRTVNITDLELNSMGSTLPPESDHYRRQLKKWKEFKGITLESGTFIDEFIPL